MLNNPIKPMLLQPRSDIPREEHFIHQLKADGHRALLHYDHGEITIFTRHKNDVSFKYPELKNIKLPVDTCILDGELVCLDQKSNPPKPCFDNLTSRFQTSQVDKINDLMIRLPVTFLAFDIIFLNGKSLLQESLKLRLKHIQAIVENNKYLSVCPTFDDGESLFERVVELGLEGIVSKSLEGSYQLDSRPSSKSRNVWYKIKNYQYDTVQIGAIRKNKFGWVMQQENIYKGILEFVPPAERKALYQISKQLVRDEDENYLYLEPLVQCKVKYQCLSKKGLMRSASFVEFVY